MPPDEILARARAYPFPRPRSSVIVTGEQVVELTDLDAPELGDAPRQPVLAYGSNASPSGLRWKFPAGSDAPFALVRGELHDLDVVYSSHIAVYGSVPATLQVSPGTAVETFVALLTEHQLELVTEWEINARLERLHGLDLELEHGEAPAEVLAYLSRHGCLTAGREEIAVAEVPARGRRFAAMTQPEVLEYVRATVAPELSLEDFVTGNVADYERARRYTAELRRTARPFLSSRRGDSNP
jgi:hypothetical protein